MNSWEKFIESERKKDYFMKLSSFLENERDSGKTIYPEESDIFNAFESTSFKAIKCCIVGQDPYFLPGLAHGLSFSVKKGVKIPRSLSNIYKELARNFDDFIIPEHGYLQDWASQGVFLLNTVLTVEKDEAGSHRKKGWETFTKAALSKINDELEGVVFLAWGKDAHKACDFIDNEKHLVIKTSHPSPLGATREGKDFSAFIGSKCFIQANNYLLSQSKSPVNWNIK